MKAPQLSTTCGTADFNCHAAHGQSLEPDVSPRGPLQVSRFTRKEFFRLFGMGILFGWKSRELDEENWNDPEWLQAWQAAPRHIIRHPDTPILKSLHAAIHKGQPLWIRYEGGSNPGQHRRISPSLLYQVEGFQGTYLTAYCHQRKQPRHFRVERLALVG